MNPDLQRYYEDRLTMFASRGWKDLVEDVQTMLTATNRLEGVTAETLPFKQGELSMMNWILTLEETSKKAYADVHLDLPNGASDGTHHDLRAEDGE